MTGGSGVAMGLPENFRRAGLLPDAADADVLPPMQGFSAVVAGSCSRATLGQIGLARDHVPVLELDALATPDAAAMAAAGAGLGRWQAAGVAPGGDRRLRDAGQGRGPAGEARPRRRRRAGGGRGRDHRGGAGERGVGRMVVAGGETSGAVVHAARRDVAAHRAGDRPRRALDLRQPDRGCTSR